jgi:hypothetical protein
MRKSEKTGSVWCAKSIGDLLPINDKQTEELRKVFFINKLMKANFII